MVLCAPVKKYPIEISSSNPKNCDITKTSPKANVTNNHIVVLELSLLRLFFAEYIEKLLKIITIVLMINAKGSSKSFSQSGLDLLTI